MTTPAVASPQVELSQRIVPARAKINAGCMVFFDISSPMTPAQETTRILERVKAGVADAKLAGAKWLWLYDPEGVRDGMGYGQGWQWMSLLSPGYTTAVAKTIQDLAAKAGLILGCTIGSVVYNPIRKRRTHFGYLNGDDHARMAAATASVSIDLAKQRGFRDFYIDEPFFGPLVKLYMDLLKKDHPDCTFCLESNTDSDQWVHNLAAGGVPYFQLNEIPGIEVDKLPRTTADVMRASDPKVTASGQIAFNVANCPDLASPVRMAQVRKILAAGHRVNFNVGQGAVIARAAA